MLPSGLPEIVSNDEDLARFLTQSGHFNRTQAKPAAFMPSPLDRETSVSRHSKISRQELWEIGEEVALTSSRKLHGAVIIKAIRVRDVGLEAESDEPPNHHAIITNWPWDEKDPEDEKAKRKELAIQLASLASAPILA